MTAAAVSRAELLVTRAVLKMGFNVWVNVITHLAKLLGRRDQFQSRT